MPGKKNYKFEHPKNKKRRGKNKKRAEDKDEVGDSGEGPFRPETSAEEAESPAGAAAAAESISLLTLAENENAKSPPDNPSLQSQHLLDALDSGINIGLDLAKFKAKWEKSLARMAEEDDPTDKAIGEYEQQQQKKYISTNPWPAERLVWEFIHNKQERYTHRSPRIKTHGPRYYNHSLAKELYEAGALTDSAARKTEFRRVGWKIKAYAEFVAGKNAPQEEILECMRAYFYILNHVICGGELLPPPGHMNPVRCMTSIIEFAWDDIGLWKA